MIRPKKHSNLGIDWDWFNSQTYQAQFKIAKGWLNCLKQLGFIYEPKKGNYRFVKVTAKDNKALIRKLDKIMRTERTYRLNWKPNGKIEHKLLPKGQF